MKKILALIIVTVGVFSFLPQTVRAFDPACIPGPYNRTTGKLCTAEEMGTRCPQGDKYSRVTGKLCNFWDGSVVASSNSPLIFVTKKIPNYTTFGERYSTDMIATGGTGQYTWTVSSGALPPGIELKQYGTVVCIKAPCVPNRNAVISGAATRSGVYGFTLQVVSGVQKLNRSFSIVVSNT